MKFTHPWSEWLHDAGTPLVSSGELAELVLEEIRSPLCIRKVAAEILCHGEMAIQLL